jgi:hypothetical protein
MKSTFALPMMLAALAVSPSAYAIQGSAPVRAVAGERLSRVENPSRQRALAQQPAWQSFLARRGGAWTARWDEATSTPTRFYGEGWGVDGDALATDDGAFAIAEAILRQEEELLGRDVRAADLRRGVVDRTDGITTVTFQQTWRGLRVDETRLSLRFKADRFVMGQVETLPGLVGLDVVPQVSDQAALQAALAHLGWDAPDRLHGQELVVLPIRGERSVQARLAWRLQMESDVRRSHPVLWVDAVDGSVLGWEEQVRHASGTIAGTVDDRYPENGDTDTALVWAEVASGDGSSTADGVGVFSLPGAAPHGVSLQVGSDDFRIDSDGGETTFSTTLPQDGGTALVAADGNASAGAQRRQTAELDVHVSAHISRDRALLIHPTFQWAGVQARVNVNVTDDGGGGTACNAWFNPSNSPGNSSVNFLRQGGGCNNMGRVWDVMFHEYGHGFHIWSIIFGAGDFDGALGEGLGDYMSATINDDSGMARGFFQGSSAGLRDIGPNLVWPDDIDSDIHITGLIIAGALWDLRTALQAEQGEAGVALADRLFLAVAQRASDVPTSYEEVLLADDDNGNLADGTPNECLIHDAFGLHGLGPGGGVESAFAATFDPLGDSLPPGEPIEIAVRVDATSSCADTTVGGVRLGWTVDGALTPQQFTEVDMVASGDADWTASLPALADGSYVRYWIEILDGQGAPAQRLPQGSISDPWYGAWVGGESLWEADFESGDAGFTSSLLEGGDQEGANDWMREPPKGGGGDPVAAASGSFAWGNDLQPQQNWNGLYQSNVHNVLRSGPIDVGDGPVQLQFRRWLTIEDGLWDQAWVEVNGTTVWENFASPNQQDSSSHHIDTHWAFRSYDVTELVQGGQIEVEWHLQSDGALTFGGWTIDDVRVLASEGGGVIGGDDDDDAAGDDDDDDDAGPGPGGGGGGGFGGSGCTCDSSESAPTPWSLALRGLLLPAARRRRS